MKRMSTLAAVSATLLLASGLVACGSTGAARDKNEIVIGDIGTYEGVMAPHMARIPDVLDGWARLINDNGGIKGKTVRVVHKDVGGGAAGAGLTAARKLVTQDKVDAIVTTDGGDFTWVPYVTKQKIPVVSGNMTASALVDPMMFPTQLTPVTLGYAYTKTAQGLGPNTAIAYAAENPAAKGVVDQEQSFGKPMGLSVAMAQPVSSSLPDYTALCQSLKDSRVDSYQLFFSKDVALKITRQCHDQGLRIPQIVPEGILPPSFATEPSYQRSVVLGFAAPYFDTALPGVRQYRELTKRYVPGLDGSDNDTAQVMDGYVAIRMVQAALERVTGDVSPESITAALHTIKNENLDGLIAPVTYVGGETTRRDCWFSWEIKGNAFTLGPSGANPICADPAALKSAEQDLIKSIS